jgi:uncharacterized protein
MKRTLTLLVIILAVADANQLFAQRRKDKAPLPRVLLYTKTTGFRHQNIRDGIMALQKLGEENKFQVTATEDSSMFVADTLSKFAAVIFFNSTGNVLNDEEQSAFEQYIRNGGGFVGIHAAADCEYDWPWYGKLVGAYFKSHPRPQTAKLEVINKEHPSTKKFPDVWEHFDEWYNFKNINPDVKVLVRIDEKSYTGGDNGDNHPITWYHAYDGGRAFYTELGHTSEDFLDPMYLKHVLGGIRYAMGQ